MKETFRCSGPHINCGLPVSYGDYNGKPPKCVRNAVDDPAQKLVREQNLIRDQQNLIQE